MFGYDPFSFLYRKRKCEDHRDDKRALSVALVMRTASIGQFKFQELFPLCDDLKKGSHVPTGDVAFLE